MVKRYAVILAALTAALFGLAVPTVHAGEDQRPCVSREEFNAVEDGWTKERVTNKFDFEGWRIGTIIQPDGDVFRTFVWEDSCWDSDIEVEVRFKEECCSLRVVNKWAEDFVTG